MEPQFSELQILIDLGLTLKQARVYLTLIESGPIKVSEISKRSQVARPDVYPALSKLQQLGIVEKIIQTPLEYRAIPIRKGLKLLLDAKEEQHKELVAGTQILLRTIERKKSKEAKKTEEPQLVLIPRGRTVIEEIKTAIEKAELSVDLVLSWKRFSQGIASVFAESIETAWAKNVKIQFLIESPQENKTAKQLVQFCREKPCCQVRFISHYPKATFGIYDKKEILIILKSKTDLPDAPALWSKNPKLIALAEDYFEKLWLTAMKEPSQPPLA